MKKKVLVVLAVMVMLAAVVEARGPARKYAGMTGMGFEQGGRGLHSAMLLLNKVELQLSEQQVKKIQELCNVHQETMIKKQSEIRLLQNKMRQLYWVDTIDRKEAEKLIRESDGLKTELRLLALQHNLAIRELLSADQLNKLQELRYERRMRNPGDRGRFGERRERRFRR